MSKRMTDERMAEIEATLYEDTDNVEELLQALKAERAEVERLRHAIANEGLWQYLQEVRCE